MKVNEKYQRSTLDIGGILHPVLLCKYQLEEDEDKSVNQLHHIQIIDRSYSMSDNIDALIEDVIKTINTLPNGDLFSIIWFSDEDKCSIVIKGATKIEGKMDNYYKLLRDMASCNGCTCFSVPIQKMIDIVTELKGICPYFNVTLFTDGCSCCNITDDESLAVKMVKEFDCKDDILSFNTIGYGNYYNKKFLMELSESTIYGRFNHSDKITDYSKIYSHNFSNIRGLVNSPLEIHAKGAESILYLNRRTSKFVSGEDFYLPTLNKDQKILIIYPEGYDKNNIDLTKKINSSTLTKVSNDDIRDVDRLNIATMYNIYYTLAYEYYYLNMRRESLNILANNVLDKNLIDSHINAFSRDEVADHLKKLHESAFGVKSKRNKLTASKNYIPDEKAYCLIDLLRSLAQCPANKFKPDFKNYNKIGRKTTDQFNLFNRKVDIPVEASFSDLVFNKSNLNISIRCIIPGFVKINPKQASKVGLDTVIDSKIYRTYTIIKDGNLNMDKMECLITGNVLNEVNSSNTDVIANCRKVPENNMYDVVFDLTKLPIINASYENSVNDLNVLGDIVYNNFRLEVAQKVLNYRIKSYEDMHKEVTYSSEMHKFTPEQIKILEEHGLNSRLEYVGVDNKTADKNESDYYLARSLEFYIKGNSSIPPIDKTISSYDETNPKNSLGKKLIYQYYNEFDLIKNDSDYISSKNKLDGIKKNLISNRIDLATAKLAKIITGGWWNFDIDNKDNSYFNKTVNLNDNEKMDLTIMVKSGYDKKYI